MTDRAVSEGTVQVLKRDLFGQVARLNLSVDGCEISAVARDTQSAKWWVRPLARLLARREQRALRALAEFAEVTTEVPQLLDWPALSQRPAAWERAQLRSWLDGEPMQVARPSEPAYFAAAMRLIVRVHRAGVTHNDLAKEPNWLVSPDGRPRLIDFQLASVHRRRGRRFRLQAREDLRHLLKHKRTYCPAALTPRELHILANPSGPARWWRRIVKPIYLFVTRRVLGWSDREGAGDRGRMD